MGHLWDIVQAHRDAYGPSVSEIARRIGMSSSGVHAWNNRGIRAMPESKNLRKLAEVTGRPYREVLRAALLDAGYETEETWPPAPPPRSDVG